MGIEWIEGYQQAWNSHDGEQVAAFMAENVLYEDLLGGATFEGREAIRRYVGSVHEWSSDYRFVVVSAQSSGDRYAFEWEMVGTGSEARRRRAGRTGSGACRSVNSTARARSPPTGITRWRRNGAARGLVRVAVECRKKAAASRCSR